MTSDEVCLKLCEVKHGNEVLRQILREERERLEQLLKAMCVPAEYLKADCSSGAIVRELRRAWWERYTTDGKGK